jgi:two-component system response regulator NreC
MAKIRVLIADDHAILRSGVGLHLAREPDIDIVAEAEDSALAVRYCAETQPDVAVLDISMPGMSGIDAIEKIRGVSPATRVLMLTMHDDQAYLRKAMTAGAAGYIVKTIADDELIAAIRAVHRGHSYVAASLRDASLSDILTNRTPTGAARDINVLSDREQQVLTMVAYGHTYKEIAEQLELSVKTVETYRTRLGEKLGLRSRVDLVRYALEKELLSIEGLK